MQLNDRAPDSKTGLKTGDLQHGSMLWRAGRAKIDERGSLSKRMLEKTIFVTHNVVFLRFSASE